MSAEIENIDVIEEQIQNKKAVNYDELFFQSIAEFPIRKRIADYLKRKGVSRSAKIIDVGCGTGELLLYLQSQGYQSLYGNDISEMMLKIASNKVKNGVFFHGSINKVQIPEKFDFIIITEALHHIPDLELTFESLKKLLNPNGEIVLLEPNEKWFFEDFPSKRRSAIYWPVALLHKYAGYKNKELINRNREYDTPDTFNPFHRHLTIEEVKAAANMKVDYTKYFTFYMGLFESCLFKKSAIDQAIYRLVSVVDSLVPMGDKGKYFLLVLKNKS
jgi:2-polyprenyl-3-methyl-5-hydroxy-6-metoxy-1,4-benzoquinol methylase